MGTNTDTGVAMCAPIIPPEIITHHPMLCDYVSAERAHLSRFSSPNVVLLFITPMPMKLFNADKLVLH